LINADGQPRDVITIGGSAGAIEALLSLFGKLPASVPAAIFVVVHRPPLFESQLVHILGRRTKMPVREPEDGQPVQPGRVYLAPRDYHMVFEDGVVRLNRGPQFHRFRPAVDPLFLSAAEVYGPRVVGVLLSGGGADGVRGLIAIKARGGVSIVQDPREARNPTMPSSAIADDDVDAVLRLDQMADALASLATGGASASR
jgi:two-component system chemotaxis response regulator CheB